MFRNPHCYIATQALVEFCGNALLNGVIGWYWTEGLERVPLWGWLSIASDLVGTCFGIGFVLTLVFTWRFHRRLRAGLTQPLTLYPGPSLPRLVHGLPLDPWARSLLIASGALAIAGLAVLAIQMLQLEGLSRTEFIALKALLAGVVAFITMNVAGYRALGDGVTPERPLGDWPERHLRGT